MAFTELERKRCEREMERYLERSRPPMHIRPKLDIGYRVTGQSIEIFEIRPHWQSPKEILEHPVAKTTFVRTTESWRIYWMRRDLKWHGYEPTLEVDSLSAFLAVVERDEYCCFFG